MTTPRKLVLAVGAVLAGAWGIANFGRITADEDGFIRFVLGCVFGALILLRWKPARERPQRHPAWLIALAAAGGALLAVLGLVFAVHQFEWLGIILILYACLAWSLPPAYGRDVVFALFLVYWVHPLPGQIFGRLQLAMQWLSVHGSEALLRVFNIRVWADGLVLRTGFQSFGVPESCSGMRTSVTVMLCALGVGMLFRLRWASIAALVVLGAVQVLALNIVRVSGMVFFAPRMPPEWSETFLHDTLGIFLLIAILLIHLEAAWVKVRGDLRRRRRDAIRRGEIDHPDRAIRIPRFWRRTVKWSLPVVGVLLLLGLMALVVYKQRPSHRAAMISGIVDSLMESDLDAAAGAIDAVLELEPGNRDMLSKRGMVMVMQGQYEEALNLLKSLEASGGLSTIEAIVKSWTLMALDRPEEAIAVVDALPPSAKQLPGVAIVRAEYGAFRGDADVAARNVVTASKRHMLIHRVRALYPFLAEHKQWRAIVDSDINAPYLDFADALLAVHANLQMNNMAGAIRALDRGLTTWPRDPRFLDALFDVAKVRPGSEWEVRLAENLRQNLVNLSPDRLATILKKCFEIQRPDLAWLVFNGLRRHDPEDPALYLGVVRHASEWFLFRRTTLGVTSEDRAATIDLAPVYALTRSVAPFHETWREIPLADDIALGDLATVTSTYLRRCLDELARRDREGTLSRRLELTYPAALTAAGDFDAAHERLNLLVDKYPDLHAEILYEHARIYHGEQRWQECYEELTVYMDEAAQPSLDAYMMQINCLMQLNLGVGAMEMAQRAAERFPGNKQAQLAVVGIWDAFGFRDEALHALRGMDIDIDHPAHVHLLALTGRIAEADRIVHSYGVPFDLDLLEQPQQPFLMPPAELTVQRRWPPPLSDEDLAREIEKMKQEFQDVTSPYLLCVGRRMLEWCEAGAPADADCEAWAQCGRNNLERAMSLHRLAVMQGRQGHDANAVEATEAALQFLPRSAALWRMRISLSEGELEVIRRAREACPDDATVWLAWIVARTRTEGVGQWTEAALSEATEGNRYPVRDIVRAGAFLLNQGAVEIVRPAAEYVQKTDPTYVPGHILALQNAVMLRDVDWARSSALKGADYATDPAPFYQVLVQMKGGDSADSDMLAALEYLRERYPQNTEWSELLGLMYFRERDLDRSLHVLEQAIVGDLKGMRSESLVLAAEAARLEGQPHKARLILERAHELHPDNVAILNNLVYALAQNPASLARARTLLPELLRKGGDSFAVMDTAAMVYLMSGDRDRARAYMEQALESLDENNYSALETTLNAARVQYALGRYDEALKLIERVRSDPHRPQMIEIAARDLLGEVRRAMDAR